MITTTNSHLAINWFLVLDEQSEQTSTAIMVNVAGNDNCTLRSDVRSLRVAYPVSSRYLSAASIAHPPIDELREALENDRDKGILRINDKVGPTNMINNVSRVQSISQERNGEDQKVVILDG